MNRTSLRWAIILVAFLTPYIMSAQAPGKSETEKEPLVITVHPIKFRVNSSYVEPNYLDNVVSISRLDIAIANIGADLIDSVKFVSTASPEATYPYNKWLAARRTESMARFLSGRYPELKGKFLPVHLDTYMDSETGRKVYPAENWTMFREMVVQDTSLAENSRNILLDIIDSDDEPDAKEARISKAGLFKLVLDKYYPYLRCSQIEIIWNKEAMLAALPAPVTKATYVDNSKLADWVAPKIPDFAVADTLFRPLIAFKTNMLYDIVGGFNCQVEVPIGNRLSIEVTDLFPWFHWGPNGNKWCYQVWEIGVGARYWLKPGSAYYPSGDRIPLTGLFIGPYAASAKYDLQWDRSFNRRGEYWSAGLEFGWSKHLTHWAKGWLSLNLELSAALGYADIDSRHYYPSDEYEELYRDYDNMKHIRWWGPTRAKVALVIPINYRKIYENE